MYGQVAALLIIAFCTLIFIYNRRNAENEKKARIISESILAAREILKQGVGISGKIENNKSVCYAIITYIENIKRCSKRRAHFYNSFAQHYIASIFENNHRYASAVHNYLINNLLLLKSDDDYAEFMTGFLIHNPPSGMSYIVRKDGVLYCEYYNEYLAEVKRIDHSRIVDGIHWLELTDDEGVKRAFKDGISSNKLAALMVENAKMPLEARDNHSPLAWRINNLKAIISSSSSVI
jgi:hypothetical protein